MSSFSQRRYGAGNTIYGAKLTWTKPNTAKRAAKAAAVARLTRAAVVDSFRFPPRRDVVMANVGARGLALARGEWKSVDVNAGLDGDSDCTIQLLNGIARGDDISERTGRQVVMRSIKIHWQVQAKATTGVDQLARCMLVYDKQTNAAALTPAQVLTTVGNGYAPLSPVNLENRMRFVVLYDSGPFVVASDKQNAAGAAQEVPKSGSMLTGTVTRYGYFPVTYNNGDAATVADITTGSLYFIVIGGEAAGATAADWNIYSRVRYEDK